MLAALLFSLGLIILLTGAELLVRGATDLAGHFRVAPLLLGITVVALGTSAPELAITLFAALTEYTVDVAVGNILGSNVANILLVLGLAALLRPIAVAPRLVRGHLPAMIAASALSAALAADGRIGAGDGAILLTGLGAYLAGTVSWDEPQELDAAAPQASATRSQAALRTLLGIPLLAAGSWLLVDGGVTLADTLGISDLVVGLTMIAIGTSLPEIAAAAAAARHGQSDMIVGTVIGSNCYNLLAVLGSAAIFSPDGLTVAATARYFDIPIMLAVGLACVPIFWSGYRISRWEGALLLGYYAAYCTFLYLGETQQSSLAALQTVMLGLVVPWTALALLVTAVRLLRRSRSEHGETVSASRRKTPLDS